MELRAINGVVLTDMDIVGIFPDWEIVEVRNMGEVIVL